jgi:hypothetical protein
VPVIKLNPTGRNMEIEVPVKADGAILGNVAIRITPDDKLLVDAKLLKTYLGKLLKPEMLTAALAVPAQDSANTASGAMRAGKKAPGAVSSPALHPAPGTQETATSAPGALGQEPPSYLPLELIKQRGIDISYDPQATELVVVPALVQRCP